MSRARSNLPKVRNLREVQAEVEVQPVELDPTTHGYSVAWNYSTRFWLPLLGATPWAVWQTLLSFCFGPRDTCWPSINLIAGIAANSNRHAILGRWRGKGGQTTAPARGPGDSGGRRRSFRPDQPNRARDPLRLPRAQGAAPPHP